MDINIASKVVLSVLLFLTGALYGTVSGICHTNEIFSGKPFKWWMKTLILLTSIMAALPIMYALVMY